MTETATPTPEEVRSRRERGRSWFGYLADDNVDHVVERISNLLTGRRYTFVAYNVEHAAFAHPEVRTGQRLSPRGHTDGRAIHKHRIGDPLGWAGEADEDRHWTSAGLSVADTYGSWGLHSSHATEAEAADDWGTEKNHPRRHRCTYLHIEGGRTDDPRDVGRSDRIEVRHFNYMNPPQMLVWVIAIEPDEVEER